jgi:Phage gp6-like head-tail connector protein
MATALTTLAAVKTAGQITNSGDDNLLNELIAAASSYIAVYCSREFGSVTTTIELDGNGRQKLFLPLTPIISVAGVRVEGRDIPARSGHGLNAFGFFYSSSMVMLVGPYSFTEGFMNVEVDLTYGFETIPPDVSRACTELVISRYRARQRMDMMSQSMAGQSATFIPDEFSRWARSVLSQYKNVVPL